VLGLERTARLFFALSPSERMQADLAEAVASALRSDEPLDGRPVPEAKFHLTLAFLGSVPRSQLELLFEVGAQCARSLEAGDAPIAVTLETLEHWRKPQVLVATSRATPPAAVVLAETLKRVLIERSFSPDLKPFRAHATVARKVRRVSEELQLPPVRWTFDALHLVESGSGSTYSTVKKWILDK